MNKISGLIVIVTFAAALQLEAEQHKKHVRPKRDSTEVPGRRSILREQKDQLPQTTPSPTVEPPIRKAGQPEGLRPQNAPDPELGRGLLRQRDTTTSGKKPGK